MPPAFLATLGDALTGVMLIGLLAAALVGAVRAVRAAYCLHNRRVDVVRRNTPQPRHAAPHVLAQRAR